MIQYLSEGLRTRVMRWCNSQSEAEGSRTGSVQGHVQGQEKVRVPAQKKRESTLPLLFCPIWGLNGLDEACPHR